MAKNNLEELVTIFKRYGANDPNTWALSQVNEGINQLARFSFLKAITNEVVKESHIDWVDQQITQDFKRPGEPLSQLKPALQEMISKGVTREAIIDLVRVIQYTTLYDVSAVLDGLIIADTPLTDWGLFETDEEGNPTLPIGGIHESLLEFDPSGREFRPRS